MKKAISLAVVFALLVAVIVMAFTYPKKGESLVISKDNISHASGMLYGLSLENLSYAVDGGLCADLVKNNSFEYALNPLDGWCVDALSYSVLSKDSLNEKNLNYLSVTVDGEGSILNNGYTEMYDYKSYSVNEKKQNTPDMGFKKDEKYEFSACFKNISYEGSLTVSLKAKGNNQTYTFDLTECENWTKIIFQIESDVNADGGLLITAEGTGTFLMDFVTLVPVNSHGFYNEEWKYSSVRADLYDVICELEPKFIRFSGVQFSQCDSLKSMISWKDTLGVPEERAQVYSLANNANGISSYNNSNMFGVYEFFMLCSDLNASPVPVISAGISRQENNDYSARREAYRKGAVAEDEWQTYLDTIALRPGTQEWEDYLQDIFDLIEFANGNADTTWGSVRAQSGHKEPFNMEYLIVGDENYGEVYLRNFDAIYNAVKERFPEIKIIASASADLQGEDFTELREAVNSKYGSCLIDEHFYTSDGELFNAAEKYDNYERNGAGVIVGEWGVQSNSYGTVQTKNNIWSAIESAVFLTGLEKNADVVKLSAYSPVLSKLNAQNTDTSLIWFDSQEICLTPDYYTQLLFARNYGTSYIATDLNMADNGVYESVTVDTDNEVIYVKIVNSKQNKVDLTIDVQGFGEVKTASNQYMSELFKAAGNELGDKLHVAPSEAELTLTDNKLDFTLEGLSVNVIRIPYGQANAESLYALPEIEITTPFIHSAFITAIPCTIGVLLVITACIVSVNSYIVKKKSKKATSENQKTE